MRNKFEGVCYRCGETVKSGQGHFERIRRAEYNLRKTTYRWRLQHAECAIKYRGTDKGKEHLIEMRKAKFRADDRK